MGITKFLFWKKRTPSVEVQRLKEHLERVGHDDAKLRDQTIRKNRLVRDNHLVTDVKHALGLRP